MARVIKFTRSLNGAVTYDVDGTIYHLSNAAHLEPTRDDPDGIFIYQPTGIEARHEFLITEVTEVNGAPYSETDRNAGITFISNSCIYGTATDISTVSSHIGDPSSDNLTSLTAKFGDDTLTVKARLDAIDTAIAHINTVDLETIMTNLGDASGDNIISTNAKLGDDTKTVKERFDDVDTAVGLISGAEITTINTNIGDPSLHTLTTITAKFGDDSETVKARFDEIDTNLGDPSGDTLTSIVAKMGDDTVTQKARFDAIDGTLGDISGHTLTSFGAKMGNDTSTVKERFDTVDSNISTLLVETQTNIPALISDLDGDVAAVQGDVTTILANTGNIGDASGDTLTTLVAKLGNDASTVKARFDANDGLQAVPTADSTDNVNQRDVIGNKSDAAVTTVGVVASVIAYIKGILGRFLVPTQNTADNVTMRDVIGNKTDDEDGNSIYSKLYILSKHHHSSSHTYPHLANAVTINKVNSNAWGLDANPTEIIPASTITSPFDIHYVDLGAISNNDEYELMLFSGSAGNEVEIACVSFDRSATVTEGAVPIQTGLIAANTRISAKLTSKAAAARSITVKLFYHEY